jgi:hypothetical protein
MSMHKQVGANLGMLAMLETKFDGGLYVFHQLWKLGLLFERHNYVPSFFQMNTIFVLQLLKLSYNLLPFSSRGNTSGMAISD